MALHVFTPGSRPGGVTSGSPLEVLSPDSRLGYAPGSPLGDAPGFRWGGVTPGSPLGFMPFGWTAPCGPRTPSQVRDDVRSLCHWVVETSRAHFPAELGYRVDVCSPAGAGYGVLLAVSRGDFRAALAVESTLDPQRRTDGELAIRSFGRAHAQSIESTERASHELAVRGRGVGIGMGAVVFTFLCWAVIGTSQPLFVLAGLLMVVAAVLTMAGGGGLGAWIGEQVAETRRGRALASASANHALREDLRRWRAFARQMQQRRQTLAGRAPLPFRASPSP